MRIARRVAAALAAAALLTFGLAMPAAAALPTPELVADINPSGDSDPSDLIAYNGLLYFFADDGNGTELFVSDGTVGSATNLNLNAAGGSYPSSFIIFNSKLYFAADDGVNGTELWVVDGSNPPALAGDIEAGIDGSEPDDFTVFDGQLYFSAYLSGIGRELLSMSTAEVFSVVADVWSGPVGSEPSSLYVYNGYLYFSASDAVFNDELWRTDGITTSMFADLNPASFGGNPHYFSTAGGALYFLANDSATLSYNYELFTTDGLSAPLELTTDLQGANGFQYYGVYNDTLFFSAGNASIGQELGRTSGGSVPTFLDINPGAAGSFPQDFTAFNGQLWFGADNGSNGFELMHTDGVSAPVAGPQIAPGAADGFPYYLLPSGSSMYMVGSTDGASFEIWVTDGTTIEQATNLYPGGNADPYYLTTFGGYLYFSAQDSTNGSELWRVQVPTLAAAGSGGSSLAATGVEANALGVVAAAFVLAGGILLMRRRRLA